MRLVRTLIEGSVLLAGFLLGGTLWWGTLLYALAIGPLIQAMLPWFQTAAPVPLADPAGSA